MKVLIFDNYDSFTYNLVHIVEDILQQKTDVYRNDEIELADVNNYDKIILSPGPGIPSEAGLLLPLLKEYAPTKSILGVCLGHQAIAETFGGTLENLSTVFHGVAHSVILTEAGKQAPLFQNMPHTFEAGRYHSWVVSKENLPEDIDITGYDEQGYIMALQHKQYKVQGVQFHPESVLTPQGRTILQNWLQQ